MLVVGGGLVAASKIEALRAAGARITVVAPDVSEPIRASGVRIVERPFEPADLDGQWLVVCRGDAGGQSGGRRGAANGAASSSTPWTIRPTRAPISAACCGATASTVAISTNGRAPALAGLLREGLDAMLPRGPRRVVQRARTS